MSSMSLVEYGLGTILGAAVPPTHELISVVFSTVVVSKSINLIVSMCVPGTAVTIVVSVAESLFSTAMKEV